MEIPGKLKFWLPLGDERRVMRSARLLGADGSPADLRSLGKPLAGDRAGWHEADGRCPHRRDGSPKGASEPRH